ncbi:MmyB family transcriptional regulator [Nocardia nova]|uniref:MmyB family transcriptional regulator n=1 Tax=Nocardia nova TaxID=37330 RepID=UPI0033E4334E
MNTTSGRASAGRHERGRARSDTAAVISLASWLRAIREQHHGLTRRQAAPVIGVGVDYLKNIEYGTRPSQERLEDLIKGYRLDCSQARLTWDLWRPSMPLPPVAQLRERIATPDRREFLARLDQSGIAIAYLDPLWNILAANETFYKALPGAGLSTGGNFAAWALPPEPQESPIAPLLVDPDREAQFLVGMLRGGFARYRRSPQVCSLYAQLSRNPAFERYWHTTVHVAYGRCLKHPQLHLRDPETGQPYTLDLQITELTDFPEVRGFVAWPPPQLKTP